MWGVGCLFGGESGFFPRLVSAGENFCRVAVAGNVRGDCACVGAHDARAVDNDRLAGGDGGFESIVHFGYGVFAVGFWQAFGAGDVAEMEQVAWSCVEDQRVARALKREHFLK